MIIVIALAHVAMTSDGIEIGAVVSMSFFLEPSFEAIQSPLHSSSTSSLSQPPLLLFLSQLPLLYKSNLLPGNAFWLAL